MATGAAARAARIRVAGAEGRGQGHGPWDNMEGSPIGLLSSPACFLGVPCSPLHNDASPITQYRFAVTRSLHRNATRL
jgi:hypothetical protein